MGILSTENVLRELAYVSDHSQSREELLNEIASILEVNFGDINGDLYLNEAEQYNKVVKHLRLDILDVERYIKENDCKCVSNPRAFVRDRIPSDDGLLSNEIFGLTPDERAGTFGYIDLHGIFLDPSCFKAWIRIDSKIRNVVHGIGTYRVDEEGQIVEDPAGKTGIRWLYSVKDKIKFKKKESISRDISRQYVESNRDKMWITKYIVIPPFYRDKNVSSSSSKVVGLGGVNKLYSDLIIATNALKETQDYLFDPSNTMYGRVQEIILNIYDWFCGNTNKNIKTDMGAGLSGKFGLIQGAALSKTANFTSRLVISAPELKVNTPKDLMVDFEKSAIPIATCMTNFKDFVTFHCKRFFENEFQGKTSYPVYDEKTDKIVYEELDDPMIAFSDEKIKHEMDRFLHGYNNRFVPIEVPIINPRNGKNPYMVFTGNKDYLNTDPESIFHRRLTWLDVFFIATCEAVTNKQVLITRFPINLRCYNLKSVA